VGEQVVDLYGVLRMNASGWTATIKAAGAEAETMAGRTRAGFAALQKAGFAVAAGLVAVGAASVKMAANFDAHMELIHTQAGASQAEVDKLKQHVLALAPITGQGPQALADGLYHIESAGFRGVQALAMLADAAKGAAIGNADLEAVTQAMIGTMAVQFRDVHGSADAMAFMNKIVGIGDMRMEKLAQSIATGVLPAFKSAGLGMTDYGAALATLTDNVTPADEAATRLRMTVSLMSAPSGPAIKALHSIGIGSTTLANDLRKPDGLLVAVMDLKHHLEASGKTAAQQNQVIQKAFGGGRTSGAILTLLEETDRLKSKYHDLGSSTQRVSEYHKSFVATQQQVTQQWKEFTATLQKLGIELGNSLIPKLQAAFGFLSRHQTVVKALAIVIGGFLVAALVAATIAVVQFTIALLTNPITWIILGITALVVAIVLLVRHWSTVWAFIKRIAADVAHAVVAAWDSVKSHTVSIWHSITSAVSSAWHSVAAFFSHAWHDVADPVERAWHKVESVTKTVWNAISGFFRKWWPLLFVIFFPYIAVFVAAWNHFHRQIMAVVTMAWNFVTRTLRTDWHAIQIAAAAIWAVIMVSIVRPVEATWHRVVQIWRGEILPALRAVWSVIKTAAAGAWAAIRVAIINPITDTWHKVTSLFDKIKAAVGHALHGALNDAKSTAGHFADVGRAIIEGIVHGVTGTAGKIGDAVKQAANNALQAAKSFLGINSPSRVFADQVGRGIPEGIALGVDQHARVAHAAVANLADGLGMQGVPYAGGPGGAGLTGSPAAASAVGGVVVVNHFHIAGTVLAERQLLDLVRQNTQRYARRNIGTGLASVGR
jgi:TP901 family phage tail tape measure protein